MAVRNRKEYIESLRRQKPKAYLLGEEIKSIADPPDFKVGIDNAAVTYEIAHHPQYRPYSTVMSPLINEPISLWTHIPRGPEDLLAKIEVMKGVGERLCPCCYRCLTTDNLSGAWAISYEIDQKYQTQYHARVIEIVKEAQRNDWFIGTATVDPKGDRRVGPSRQTDPDMYLRVVEKRKDGIVVKGAKLHSTASPYVNMLCIVPPAPLEEGDRDYAVGFFTPVDAEGITFICRPHPLSSPPKEMENPYSSKHGGHVEAMVLFDDVFVPWERVYMCGEVEFATKFGKYRAPSHAMHKCMCRWASIDLAIGATALIADCNGLEGAYHIQDALSEMMMNAEIAKACALAAALQGWKHESGVYLPKAAPASAGKLYLARSLGEERFFMQDAAGGLVVTMVAEEDYRNPKTRPLLDKYYKGREGIPTEDRMRAFRLIEDLTGSAFAGWYHAMSISGGAPPQAHKNLIRSDYDLGKSKKKAKIAAGIEKLPPCGE
jgi:4-hydroxybutyryl-CoA dehydratase / vinylacetyl-CoA-Delta-isomerase